MAEEQTVRRFKQNGSKGTTQRNVITGVSWSPPPHPPHLFKWRGFLLPFYCMAPHYRWLQLIQSSPPCAQNINGYFTFVFFLSPLGAAQAGAIDVISFPEARGEDPAAIYCLSAVLKRQRVPSVRRRVMNHGGPAETLRLAPAGLRDNR